MTLPPDHPVMVALLRKKIEANPSILYHFAELIDPRRVCQCQHELTDVIVIALCAVLSGANSWQAIAVFGESKKEWFARFLKLPNGIPSHDTFSRVFAAMPPQAFRDCFVSWITSVCERLGLKHLQIDGKTHRGSANKKKKMGCLHTVSVWAAQSGLTLGEVAVDTKSNEITAIPKLLAMLDLEGALVTIDAMGCQKDIARRIRTSKGHYLLAVKDNQLTLHKDIKACFTNAMDSNFKGLKHEILAEETKKGHGRRETRVYVVIYNPTGLSTAGEWPDLKAIVMVYRERQVSGAEEGKGYSDEVSYYVTSSTDPIGELAVGIRSHWGIENKVHWVLDVVFKEDESRTRTGHAEENFGWLRRVALSLLKQEGSKESINCKRHRAGWNDSFLEKVLGLLDENLLSTNKDDSTATSPTCDSPRRPISSNDNAYQCQK
jgi:predicted transposase YbfD/YdcC